MLTKPSPELVPNRRRTPPRASRSGDAGLCRQRVAGEGRSLNPGQLAPALAKPQQRSTEVKRRTGLMGSFTNAPAFDCRRVLAEQMMNRRWRAALKGIARQKNHRRLTRFASHGDSAGRSGLAARSNGSRQLKSALFRDTTLRHRPRTQADTNVDTNAHTSGSRNSHRSLVSSQYLVLRQRQRTRHVVARAAHGILRVSPLLRLLVEIPAICWPFSG